MSPEPAIIDSTTIQVKCTTKDNFGNLIVTPTDGDDVKISEKRKQLFDFFQQGNVVKLYWAEYMQKRYVAKAEVEQEAPKDYVVKETKKSDPAPQAMGMWWKELGEMIRTKDIDLSTPHGKLLRSWYYAEMFRVLDIKID